MAENATKNRMGLAADIIAIGIFTAISFDTELNEYKYCISVFVKFVKLKINLLIFNSLI